MCFTTSNQKSKHIFGHSPFLHYPLVPSFRKINIGKTGNQTCSGYLFFQYRFFVSRKPADNAKMVNKGEKLLSHAMGLKGLTNQNSVYIPYPPHFPLSTVRRSHDHVNLHKLLAYTGMQLITKSEMLLIHCQIDHAVRIILSQL